MTCSGDAAQLHLYRSIVTFRCRIGNKRQLVTALSFCACPFVPALLAARNQRQIATHNEDSERYSHQESAHPEAPISMHPMPIGTWVRLTVVAAMSFVEVPVSCHIASDYIVAFGDAVVCESSRHIGATLRDLWLGGCHSIRGCRSSHRHRRVGSGWG